MSFLTIGHIAEGDLVSSEGVPIGLIGPAGRVTVPSGATYNVRTDGGTFRLASNEGGVVASLNGSVLRDETSGVEWAVRPDWRTAYRDGRLDLDEVWGQPYTLEDAQSTVPNRVRLLLAWAAIDGNAGQ